MAIFCFSSQLTLVVQDQELQGSYMKTINVNFSDSSSVDSILEAGVKSFHCVLPRSSSTLLGPGAALNEVQRYLYVGPDPPLFLV